MQTTTTGSCFSRTASGTNYNESYESKQFTNFPLLVKECSATFTGVNVHITFSVHTDSTGLQTPHDENSTTEKHFSAVSFEWSHLRILSTDS